MKLRQFKNLKGIEKYVKREGIVIEPSAKKFLEEIEFDRQSTVLKSPAVTDAGELGFPEELETVSIYEAMRSAKDLGLNYFTAIDALSMIFENLGECQKTGKKIIVLMYPVGDAEEKSSFAGEYWGDFPHITAYKNCSRLQTGEVLFVVKR